MLVIKVDVLPRLKFVGFTLSFRNTGEEAASIQKIPNFTNLNGVNQYIINNVPLLASEKDKMLVVRIYPELDDYME